MTRRSARGRDAQLGFEALSIEGGLLSPEWLSRVAQLSAGAQSEPDYRIKKGLNLRDEIGRYWRIARAHWNDFVAGRATKANPREVAERFVVSLLRDSFEFGTIEQSDPVVIAERSYPIGFAALGGRVPVIVASAGAGLETLSSFFGDGTRRRNAFGLAQEYLNAQESALWGIASDGVTLRILRDNASLTRPAWIEADLQRIFTEERYADFAALWLLAHETRFGRADQPVTECALETWRNAGREEGTRAREHLRRGVEDALLALGQGFIGHPENQSLRSELQSGVLSTKDYFNQLLRLVYRLIFLLTAEERGLLHSTDAEESAKTLYAAAYGMRRLRERSVKRSAHDRYADLWEGTKIVLRGLTAGEPRLGLPALAGIFAPPQCPALDAAKLTNSALLLAVFKLAWLREDGALARVNWRDMGPEELGSVYESLLELVPQITHDGRKFGFASGSETKGNARKTTGSYYTPDGFVQVLLDNALEPVIADTIARNLSDPSEALLGLSIVDPACGSGHFLLAAARRLASHVARLKANGTPSSQEYRHALRQVVGRCIYGVDLNPMAVELCRVSLWMEAIEPGLPLTFLNSHIQRGNALLGTTPDLIAKGIPDAAWEPIEGDDKKVASALKKQNKKERTELSLDFSSPPASTYARLGAGARAVDEEDDATLVALQSKERHWSELIASAAFEHQRLLADTWCAAFVWRKQAGLLRDIAPTEATFRAAQRDGTRVSRALREEVDGLRQQYAWFHWHLQFPQVFSNGGFDVVLGNPPWDSLLFREEEFFSERRPDIAKAATASIRKKLVAKLETEDPALLDAYRKSFREIEGMNALVRSGGRYPLCGVGRVNLFALFAETNLRMLRTSGRAGFIVPTAIATDDTTKLFFEHLMQTGRLASLFSFWETRRFFPGTDSRNPFALLVLRAPAPGNPARCAFDLRNVEQINDADRAFDLAYSDVVVLNPTTKTCPIFRRRRDAEITMEIYRRLPVLTSSGWNLELRRLLNSADDSGSFLTAAGEGRLPLYEGKYFHQYEHRWVTNDGRNDRELTPDERVDPGYFVRPRHWFPASDAQTRFGGNWRHSWVLAWRDITRSTDERTFIATVVPSLAVPHTAKVVFAQEKQVSDLPALLANVDAIIFDYVARQKLGGTHMSAFVVEQLPALELAAYGQPTAWTSASLRDWLFPRVLELIYTAWDLKPFAQDVGYEGPPFRWDPARRSVLRCEIDAAFFHLYGLSRDDAEYVMDTFSIVQKNDEKAHGEYRTKRVILEIYDAMTEAARKGRAYETHLDPPPADPRVAHAWRLELPRTRYTQRMDERERVAETIWAVVHASGGRVSRSTLTRSFSLLAKPELLARLSPDALAGLAEQWRTAVGPRFVTPGLLAAMLYELESRRALVFAVDADGAPTVGVGEHTPSPSALDEWAFFEARLSLAVATQLASDGLRDLDAALPVEDRVALKAV